MAWVWVPVKHIPGREPGVKTEHLPDVPDGVPYASAAKEPGDTEIRGNCIPQEMRKGHPQRGKPLLSLCRIWVRDKDLADGKITTAKDPGMREQVISHTWLLAERKEASFDKIREYVAEFGALTVEHKSVLGEAVSILAERGHITAEEAMAIAREGGFADAAVPD